MKQILLIIVLSCASIAHSQQKTFESQVSKIAKKIEQITKQQKDSLKDKVKKINLRLDKGEITEAQAEELKKAAAEYHARQIEKLVGKQEQLLQQLVQDKTNGKIASSEYYEEETNTFTIGNKTFRFDVSDNDWRSNRESRRKKRWKRKNKYSKSTTSQFVFAMGVNNILVNDEIASIDDSEYQFWRSRFYELGWTWKTHFGKKPSQLYFKYGASFLWNNLRPENNQQHVVNGTTTQLETRIDEVLEESRLRHVQLIFPVHLELDFSKDYYSDEDKRGRDRTNKSVRMGLGGFFGFKLGTRQYLEYRNLQGVKVDEVQKNDFNMHTFNYGVSAYIGYRSCSLYAKYDLNPLFRGTETRNISIGVRLDLN